MNTAQDAAGSESAVSAELPSRQPKTPYATTGGIDVNGAVRQQLQYNPFFIPAFVSSIRHAPIHAQHDRWRLVGQRLRAQKESQAQTQPREPIGASPNKGTGAPPASDRRRKRILLLLGAEDSIVRPDEVVPDTLEALGGKKSVEVKVFGGAGHEVPMSHAEEVGRWIWSAWTG